MKRFLLLWLAGASLIAFGLGNINMTRLYPLMHRGAKTCGTVTAFEPKNHGAVHYSYQVGGETYVGVQQGGVGSGVTAFSSDCGGYVVFYLPEKPTVSCIGDPTAKANNEADFIIFSMLVFPLFALLAWTWRYPTFRRWLNADTENSNVPPPQVR
jgi:hypothetical protein